MILDKIEHWEKYACLAPGLARGLELLASGKLDTLVDGKHEIDGDGLYASVQTYTPKAPGECRWEAHRRYIDIQYLVNGCEHMGYTPVESLAVAVPYDDSQDLVFFGGGPEFGTLLKVGEKMFAVFFPTDAHMPMLSPEGKPGQVKKIVLKVRCG
ncbi:MAG: DUF386 domain-containing protein [Candidatus Firestonebacteria bacterium]|nr:DUF386 domain-containing protein [Candidatus Firestonebacteria bacterium]